MQSILFVVDGHARLLPGQGAPLRCCRAGSVYARDCVETVQDLLHMHVSLTYILSISCTHLTDPPSSPNDATHRCCYCATSLWAEVGDHVNPLYSSPLIVGLPGWLH